MNISKVLKVISIVLGSICLLALFFYYSITKTLDDYLSRSPNLKELETSYKLEEESLVHKNQLTFFKKFYDFGNFEDLNLEKISEGNLYKIKTDILYRRKFLNECENFQCVQFREDFSKIPSSLWKTLIGIEDSRFLDHSGIDIISIMRAIIEDLKAMKIVQGASTITQQLAKNLFLSNEKSLKRKIKEMIFAYYLEKKYEKDQILNIYFNEMEWGSLGSIRIKGIKAASLFYFGKNLEELEEYESVILITMLKGPYYYSPLNHLERIRKRVDIDFNKLITNNLLYGSSSGWDQKKWEIFQKKLKKNIEENLYSSIWYSFTDKTFEPYYSFILKQSSSEILNQLRNKHPNINFSYKFLRQDLNCKDCTGEYFYTSHERKLNEAIEIEKHQIGSLLKPIITQILIDNGKEWSDIVTTEEISLKLISGEWNPKEAYSIPEKELSIADMLRKSRNNPLIRLSQEIGFEKIENSLDEYLDDFNKPLKEFPSQILGSIELSVSEIANIYKKFISKYCSYENQTAITVLSDPNLTTIKNQVEFPLNKNLFFGKTGTSNNGLDNWFLSFDGKYLTVNWVGVDGDRRNIDLKIGGASTSFKIYQLTTQRVGKRIVEFNCGK